MRGAAPADSKAKKHTSFSEGVMNLIKRGYIENVTNISSGNSRSYQPTPGSDPYILTAKGFKVIAEIFAFRALSDLHVIEGRLPTFVTLSDPKPQHHNCAYTPELDASFRAIIERDIEKGDIQFIPIYGGHATLFVRERREDGGYDYFHFDSSTGVGGIYEPAVSLYQIIRSVHPDAHFSANYDRTQKTTPGCHVQTLYVMLQMALSLSRGDKKHLREFMHELTEADRAALKEAVVIPEKKHTATQEKVAAALDRIRGEYGVGHHGLPPEALSIAQVSEVFLNIEGRKREGHLRDSSLQKKIERNRNQTTPRFNLKSKKTLKKNIHALMRYDDIVCSRRGYVEPAEPTHDIPVDQIDMAAVADIAKHRGSLKSILLFEGGVPHVGGKA